MPATLTLILQGILAAIQAAPQVAAVIESAKNFITSLVGGKVIPANLQGPLHAWVDNQAALAAAGVVMPAWQVEPDPAPLVQVPPGSPVPPGAQG